MDYKSALRTPQWQRKRLEIMERDNFTCLSCGETKKTLNVHHCTPYRKGVLPYNYDNYELVTLCEDCHREITESINYCNKILLHFSIHKDKLSGMGNLLVDIFTRDITIKEIACELNKKPTKYSY